jgi:hypothetical protein
MYNFYIDNYLHRCAWRQFNNFCLSVAAIWGGARGYRTHSSTHVVTRLVCPPLLTQRTYFFTSPYIQCTIYRAHAITARPITCLSFRDIVDLGQNFEGVACDKTISVTELDPNHKYQILRAKRLNLIRSHCGAHYLGLNGGPCSGLSA